MNASRHERQTWKRSLAAMLAVLTMSVPAEAAAGDDADPWAGLNRPIFRFNDGLDRYLLEPVAIGYEKVTPDRVEGWISNFFANLWFPVVFTNCVLQGKPAEATESFARFFVNTTIGLGGFVDVASMKDVPSPNEDFGQTLGYWGVGPGPYLVVPFLGPSNVRDTAGRLVDGANRVWPYFVPWYVTTGGGTLEVVNTRAKYLDEVRDLRESSVDYYAAVRDAYLQRREALVEDRVGADGGQRSLPSEEDLYFPETTE